jgi:hypothetical protein
VLSLPGAEADAGGFRGGETAIGNLVFYAAMRRPIFAALLVLALDPQAYAQPSFDSRGSLRAVTAASAKAPASLAEAKRRRAGSS